MMKVAVEYLRLSTLGDICDNGCIDGFRPSKKYYNTLKANPFRKDSDVISVKIGKVDEKFGGQEFVFPLAMMLDGVYLESGSGSNTSVEPWARKSGVGLEFSYLHPDHRDGDFDVTGGAGLSQMAVRMYKYLNSCIFEYPRFIMLLKSRAVVEMKIKNWLVKPISWILDYCICIYSCIVSFIGKVKTAGIKVVNVDGCDNAQLSVLGQMTETDGARFSEVHDARWFKWVLNNSFSEYGPAKAYLIYKKDKPLGFFMVKKRFHEQASHRGFKNVWLGSVVEWGCLPGYENKLLWRIVLWVMKQRKNLDAVEFPVYEGYVQKFLRRLGWQHVGDANFCYRVRPGSSFKEPKGMDNPNNWRLRAGMGDCALN